MKWERERCVSTTKEGGLTGVGVLQVASGGRGGVVAGSVDGRGRVIGDVVGGCRWHWQESSSWRLAGDGQWNLGSRGCWSWVGTVVRAKKKREKWGLQSRDVGEMRGFNNPSLDSFETILSQQFFKTVGRSTSFFRRIPFTWQFVHRQKIPSLLTVFKTVGKTLLSPRFKKLSRDNFEKKVSIIYIYISRW